MAKTQATALRKGVEKYRDDDNAVKVFELTLRNEVGAPRLLLVIGPGKSCVWPPLKQENEEICIHSTKFMALQTLFDGVKTLIQSPWG